MQAYRGTNLAPTCVVVVVGAITLYLIYCTLGGGMLKKWYFYPSVVFWLFSLMCAITGSASWWHRFVWKGTQLWSGVWSLMFLLCFIHPLIGASVGSIAFEAGVNPFVAVGVHVLIWSCVSDILKPPTNENASSPGSAS